jgi:hypothetical protein
MLVVPPADAGGARLSIYQRYFRDTYASLECMRAGTRLVADWAEIGPATGAVCPLASRSVFTSPTNIALDLLVQREAWDLPEYRERAAESISRTIGTLQVLERHGASGMFHNWYSVGDPGAAARVADPFLSSVDNLHLAYALWVIARTGPEESRAVAQRVFLSMDFGVFHDPHDGLFVGGARLVAGEVIPEKWKYRYFGSEARSLYAIGWALGLVRSPDFASQALRSIHADVLSWSQPDQIHRLLALWDGGAFQLLLPRLLIAEERYSSQLAKMFVAYGRYIVDQGEKRGLPVPAAHSACQFDRLGYQGKAGSVGLVAPANGDVLNPHLRERWEAVFTPHAAMLAAPLLPLELSDALVRAESLSDGKVSLYREGLGWMDALHVQGPRKGEVVPIQLALDQAMIALASAQLLAKDGMTAGARALHADPETRSRLEGFYRLVDQRLSAEGGRAPTHKSLR